MSTQTTVITADGTACLVIIPASVEGADQIVETLEQAGAPVVDDVVDESVGVRSRLIPIAGGGMLEVVHEIAPGSFKKGPAFAVVPRVAAVDYVTNDLAADLSRWKELPEGDDPTVECGSWHSQQGRHGYWVSAAPGGYTSDVFFGLREVRLFPLPYVGEDDGAPVLQKVEIHGEGADRWQAIHKEHFALPEKGDSLQAGPTEVAFEPDDERQIGISLTLAVDRPGPAIPLVTGEISFVAK